MSECSTMLYIKEGRKEIFYLTTHSTHFIYGYMVSDMVKDHSDSERGNPLMPLFPISSKGSFICISPDRITHTTAFVTPVVEHWLEQEIAQWVHHEGLKKLCNNFIKILMFHILSWLKPYLLGFHSVLSLLFYDLHWFRTT